MSQKDLENHGPILSKTQTLLPENNKIGATLGKLKFKRIREKRTRTRTNGREHRRKSASEINAW